jgi:hypothetical protein
MRGSLRVPLAGGLGVGSGAEILVGSGMGEIIQTLGEMKRTL